LDGDPAVVMVNLIGQGARNMRTELRQGEQVIKEGAASLQKNIETVGGRLR